MYLTVVREVKVMVEKENTQENMNTKENIEKIALELFSKRGYHAVSIRNICKEVGIKESTIYYYFKNKRAIMDSVLDKINLMIEQMRCQFDVTFEFIDDVDENAMCEVAVAFFMNYLLNPYVCQMIAILTIERMADSNASKTYDRIVFELPLQQQEKVFQKMMDRGYINVNSAKVLAQEYYAVIFFAFQKNCLGCSVSDQSIQLACEEIRANIKDIYIKMRRLL